MGVHLPTMIRTRWAAIGAAVAVSLGAGGVGLIHATSPSGAAAFVPITPCRLMDTRPAFQVGSRGTPLGPGETYSVAGTGTVGQCTIPAGATGLQLNVTAVNASLLTYLTLWPAGQTRPTASSLNPAPGQPPTPNAVTASLGGGQFSIYNLQGTVDVIADVVGYYTNHNHDDRYYTKAQLDAVPKRLVFLANSLAIQGTLVASQYGIRYSDCAATGTTTCDQTTLLIPRPADWSGTGTVHVSARFLNPGYGTTGSTRFLVRPYSFDPNSYANAGQLAAAAQPVTQSYVTYTFEWDIPAETLANGTWSLRFARANNGADATYGGDTYNDPIDLISITVSYV
jgi:hypothetical protein